MFYIACAWSFLVRPAHFVQEATMPALRAKSVLLTAYFEALVDSAARSSPMVVRRLRQEQGIREQLPNPRRELGLRSLPRGFRQT